MKVHEHRSWWTWDKPALNPSIRVNGKTHEKSAIRKDWRSARRSAYNSAREALPAFERLLDAIKSRKPTAVGAATAIVVGLVAITPAAGFISPMSAIALGAIAAVPSYLGLWIRVKTSLDDSLDVVAAHGVGGTVGALLTGIFAAKSWNGVQDGLLHGNPKQLAVQATAVVAVTVYSGVVSFIILKVISLFTPLRASEQQETQGLDISLHGEEAYLHD